MYWTLELASYLEDAPWPASKDELIDYSIRSGAPLEVVENLQELEDDGHHMSITAAYFPSRLFQTIEGLIGFQIIGYRFEITERK